MAQPDIITVIVAIVAVIAAVAVASLAGMVMARLFFAATRDAEEDRR